MSESERDSEASTERERRAEAMAETLDELDVVVDTALDRERLPWRVEVVLGVANIPDAVHDRLDYFDAEVEDVSVTADGNLALDLTTPEPLRDAGIRPVRSHGSSLVVTLTREALDVSGFDEGQKMALRAREGEIRIADAHLPDDE